VRNFYRKRQNSQVQLAADVVEFLAERSLERQQREFALLKITAQL